MTEEKKENNNIQEKKQVHILVHPKILKQWDDLAQKTTSGNRTAMLHNAVKVFELFVNNQLNGDKKESIEAQLEQIKNLLESFQERKHLLEKEKGDIEVSFDSVDTKEIKDFDIVSERILELIKSWGSLNETTISAHLNYPGWLVWTVLKKLKAMKKVKVESGEWSLYDQSMSSL